ncbi:phosphoglucosamine mutase, partial [Candidatus Bathyarchaeota archaeon]|nr:phosphoglucosamine mutase [Candidatus Bathyarchaeota archaeon]
SQVVRDVVEAYGGRVIWTRVGSVDVSRKMLSDDLKLGGEENGGVMYGPHQPVRDGAMTTALILEILARTGKRLSELFDELPKYRQMKDRVECPEELKGRVLEELRSVVEGPRVETLDGVKIWYPDSSWILVRPSGTEPIFRLYAEAKTEERVRGLVEEFKSLLEGIISRI